MARVAWSCFIVRGYISPRITKVRPIIESPKLPSRKLDSPIIPFIRGWRIIRSHMAPISN